MTNKILLSILAILFSMVVISLVIIPLAYGAQSVITPDNTGNSNTLQSPSSLPYCSFGERDNCQSIPQGIKIPISEISTVYNNGAE